MMTKVTFRLRARKLAKLDQARAATFIGSMQPDLHGPWEI